jgi:hypothetical protein
MNCSSLRLAGSALAETAITLSFTMLLLLGAMDLSLLGVYQMELDGKTFFFSHGIALGTGNVSVLNSDLQGIFPDAPSMSIAGNIVDESPPTTNEPTNYTQWGSLTNRYGGASITRPWEIEANTSMDVANLSVLGQGFTLTSANVEGETMIGNHDDDAQGAQYNSSTVYSTLVNPLTQDDQNVPPYYFTLAFMWRCDNAFSTATSCAGNRNLISLGLAEFLKSDNYNDLQNGIVPNGVFYYMGCHQGIYSAIGVLLESNTTRPVVTTSNYTTSPFSEYTSGSLFNDVYSWDSDTIYGENTGNAGQLHPLPYEAGC